MIYIIANELKMIDKNFDFNLPYQTERIRDKEDKEETLFGSADDTDCYCPANNMEKDELDEDKNKLL